MQPVQIFDDQDAIVTDALAGYLTRDHGEDLALLDGFPHIKVVVRGDPEDDPDDDKVAVISGGGSGHEPSHVGWVADGLLKAAVCGDVFASPSVDAVLAGILAVTGDAGCLLVVKNYTGDRLNFGLAAERAKTLGVKVAMVGRGVMEAVGVSVGIDVVVVVEIGRIGAMLSVEHPRALFSVNDPRSACKEITVAGMVRMHM